MSINKKYLHIRQQLKGAGVENPDLEARIILKHVLNVSDADLIAGNDRGVSPEDKRTIDLFVRRRRDHEPLSRILGEREFWGLTFKVTPAVLDPRPDTETLIEAALKRFKNNPPRTILDLGTGSGCILIALLHEWKEARGVGVDISPEALDVARMNAQINHVADRVQFAQGNWGEGIEESFDLIVSNPPYIATKEIPILDAAVRNHDPTRALDGGPDGLDAYRSILTKTKKLLRTGGAAFFEVGILQMQYVARLVEDSGLSVSESYSDLAGVPRVIEIGLGTT